MSMYKSGLRAVLALSLLMAGSEWRSGINLIFSPVHANEAGEQLYLKCSACHSFGYNRTGPDHCGVLDRRAGTVTNFKYTEAMRSSNIVWTAENLDRFLEAPLEFVPGTSMGFIGIASPTDRHDLITYMQIQNDSKDCN